MYKVTERGTEKQGTESKFEDMETINEIFEEASGFASNTLCNEDGRWVSDIAPHLRQRGIRG